MFKIKEFNKRIIIFSSLVLLFGNYLVLYFTFLKAFFNDGTVVVVINQYNEHWVELIMFNVIIAFSILAIYYSFKNVPRLRRKGDRC
jgi:hypothetical protein